MEDTKNWAFKSPRLRENADGTACDHPPYVLAFKLQSESQFRRYVSFISVCSSRFRASISTQAFGETVMHESVR